MLTEKITALTKAQAAAGTAAIRGSSHRVAKKALGDRQIMHDMLAGTDSYIEGFALRWSVAQFAAFDPTGGIPLETDKLAAARMEKQARQIFESFMLKS
jgi:hypothetical protein